MQGHVTRKQRDPHKIVGLHEIMFQKYCLKLFFFFFFFFLLLLLLFYFADTEKTSYLLYIFLFSTWRYNRSMSIASYTIVMYPILNMYAEIKRDAAD